MPAYLVFNADDLGISRGANLGVARAFRDGIVTSASLAASGPAFQHALETCLNSCPGLGIGLHLTLTAGRPVNPVRKIPDLVDRNGYFRWRFSSLFQAVGLRRSPSLLEQIELEIDAQIRKLRDAGIRPDHIDSERHVHQIPGIFEKVVHAALEYEIPFVRAGRDIGWRIAGSGKARQMLLHGGVAKQALFSRLLRRNRRKCRGLGVSDNFASYVFSGRSDLFIHEILRNPPPVGVTEVMVHPGVPDESRQADLGNRQLERYLVSGDRLAELEACLNAPSPAAEVHLSSFGQLAIRNGR